MNRSHRKLLALITATLAVHHAPASVININQTIDLSSTTVDTTLSGLGAKSISPGIGLGPLTLVQGDTVNATISFLSGQAITMETRAGGTNQRFLSLWFDDDTWTSGYSTMLFRLSNVSFKLLGAVSVINTNIEFTPNNGGMGTVAAYVGTGNGDFLPPTSAVTFTGIQTTFTIDELRLAQGFGANPRNWGSYLPRFIAAADELTIRSVPDSDMRIPPVALILLMIVYMRNRLRF
jgi:hypothetical protein